MSDSQRIHFVPAKRQTQILEMEVKHIIAVPHQQEAGTNHWCLYFSTSPTTSIRLDCQPSYSVPSSILQGGSKADLIISELPYEAESDAQAKLILNTAFGLSFGRIWDQITRHGRHKYEFDENGVGCRCWITDQIDLLYELQIIIDENQVRDAIAAILKLWPEKTPLALDQGAYYE
ncbi:uncharacterized protein N7529_006959 [Penicillium soppii]|uniref:uncharacterized protein n=1 Tax=Penicillium soppii TaxID=69789 RepID=UPI002548F0C2|nr:uncharacterized protein N7529_006959 [Penicillium soppii]KAJ5865043.1 hypothetical protein N7529_006959 [Penicillium soppii]